MTAMAAVDAQPPILNIISTHKLAAKTTRCLAILYPPSPADSPTAVGIRAKGPVAAKAITLVEIVKRRIEEKGGVWWQYNVLGSVEHQPKKAAKGAHTAGGSRSLGDDEEDGAEEEEEEEDPFTPYTGKTNKQPAVPLLTVYISLARMPGLAEKWGEQTNATNR